MAGTDPADVNAGKCVAMMTSHTRQPQIMSQNFSDYDRDGDTGGNDTDCDGDRTSYTVRPAPRTSGGQ